MILAHAANPDGSNFRKGQDKLPEPRRAKKRRSTSRRKPYGPRGDDTPPRRGTVPNVTLVKV
jgi:hypothetical protein